MFDTSAVRSTSLVVRRRTSSGRRTVRAGTVRIRGDVILVTCRRGTGKHSNTAAHTHPFLSSYLGHEANKSPQNTPRRTACTHNDPERRKTRRLQHARRFPSTVRLRRWQSRKQQQQQRQQRNAAAKPTAEVQVKKGRLVPRGGQFREFFPVLFLALNSAARGFLCCTSCRFVRLSLRCRTNLSSQIRRPGFHGSLLLVFSFFFFFSRNFLFHGAQQNNNTDTPRRTHERTERRAVACIRISRL